MFLNLLLQLLFTALPRETAHHNVTSGDRNFAFASTSLEPVQSGETAINVDEN